MLFLKVREGDREEGSSRNERSCQHPSTLHIFPRFENEKEKSKR
jgi:hypothetical protein